MFILLYTPLTVETYLASSLQEAPDGMVTQLVSRYQWVVERLLRPGTRRRRYYGARPGGHQDHPERRLAQLLEQGEGKIKIIQAGFKKINL